MMSRRMVLAMASRSESGVVSDTVTAAVSWWRRSPRPEAGCKPPYGAARRRQPGDVVRATVSGTGAGGQRRGGMAEAGWSGLTGLPDAGRGTGGGGAARGELGCDRIGPDNIVHRVS